MDFMEVNTNILANNPVEKKWRSGTQPLLPVKIDTTNTPDGYTLYPYHTLGTGQINNGYTSLAGWMKKQTQVVIDGYVGVFWEETERYLTEEFKKLNLRINWVRTATYLKTPSVIQDLIAPFLGTENSVWGTKCTLELADLYEFKYKEVPGANYDLTIFIGPGAALMNTSAPVVYLDLPKNELQLRMRTGSVNNLGADVTDAAAEMYKRFYFVDWVLLNAHKKNILHRMAVIGDAQHKHTLNWCLGSSLLTGLKNIGNHVFRVRPWFEPGAWGGHWMKDRINGLSQEEINYAWSFELIVPENGILFESDGLLLEVSFDFLMFSQRDAVMGKHADLFKDEFPIRFDFLDTWQGGNLSIQCHPSLPYIQKEFGETITQDETYYILDCQDNARVYLGFQDTIDPDQFRNELEMSRDEKIPVDIERHVQAHQAQKHDLFLIPNGTVHSAGAGNMVLEISATPYIFTFKMYDWLRLGLDGEPRAINIEHAFNNLRFDRKGNTVKDELISKPAILKKGSDWQLVHVPTHAAHFYDVHRLEFDTSIPVETGNVCHVLMLVEGSKVAAVNEDGSEQVFQYAETFVIPAAAKSYTLVNKGSGRAKVVKAFVKDNVSEILQGSY
jgi:mannose-6-phosphate isomerase class I